MRVTVLYFALLRDAMGRGAETIELPEGVATAGALRDYLVSQGEPWAGAFKSVKRIRVSVDQTMALDTTPIGDGAEVAFFPPVTGG